MALPRRLRRSRARLGDAVEDDLVGQEPPERFRAPPEFTSTLTPPPPNPGTPIRLLARRSPYPGGGEGVAQPLDVPAQLPLGVEEERRLELTRQRNDVDAVHQQVTVADFKAALELHARFLSL
jgi:hypothetical protein